MLIKYISVQVWMEQWIVCSKLWKSVLQPKARFQMCIWGVALYLLIKPEVSTSNSLLPCKMRQFPQPLIRPQIAIICTTSLILAVNSSLDLHTLRSWRFSRLGKLISRSASILLMWWVFICLADTLADYAFPLAAALWWELMYRR